MNEMPELIRDLEALARTWREHMAKMEPASEFSRAAGFFSALGLCADQLEDIIRKADEND